MKAVKTTLVAALALVSASAFAEGWSVGGYFRGGLEGQYINTETTSDSTVTNTLSFNGVDYNSGYNLGLGDERLRLNVAYDGETAGFKFRYQQSKGASFTDSSSIQYALGYVKLFQDYAQVEAGYLTDNYTATDGDAGFSVAGKKYGARVLVFPVTGLSISLTGAASDTTSSAAVYGGAAKYNFMDCNVVAGYTSDANTIYGGFKVGCWKPMSLVAEASYSVDTGALTVDEVLGFTIECVKTGVISYQKMASTGSAVTLSFYPYVSVDMSDFVAAGLSAGLDAAYETKNNAFSVTPEVTYKVGPAQVQLYYTFAMADSYMKNFAGIGYKIAF